MEQNKQQKNDDNLTTFRRKIWITTGIVAFTTVLLLIFRATFSVFLLVFAGTLIAVFFRGISRFIQKKTSWNKNLCVAISILGTLLIVAGMLLLIGAKVQAQATELMDTLPKTIENVRDRLNNSSIGQKFIERVTSQESMDKAQSFLGRFFKSTFGILGDVYVILFIGIFFTISPGTYVNGLIQLIPKKGQDKARQISDKMNSQLFNWLKGKLFAMFVVFVLTAIGLAIIGMPLWLVLALFAGLISFVPNFGPLISLIPAVLVALMQSPLTAALVTGLYILVQFLESNFITPLVQKKLINTPLALIIISQLIMGVLTGGWGLVLATPLVVLVIVLVQELYLKKNSTS